MENENIQLVAEFLRVGLKAIGQEANYPIQIEAEANALSYENPQPNMIGVLTVFPFCVIPAEIEMEVDTLGGKKTVKCWGWHVSKAVTVPGCRDFPDEEDWIDQGKHLTAHQTAMAICNTIAYDALETAIRGLAQAKEFEEMKEAFTI